MAYDSDSGENVPIGIGIDDTTHVTFTFTNGLAIHIPIGNEAAEDMEIPLCLKDVNRFIAQHCEAFHLQDAWGMSNVKMSTTQDGESVTLEDTFREAIEEHKIGFSVWEHPEDVAASWGKWENLNEGVDKDWKIIEAYMDKRFRD